MQPLRIDPSPAPVRRRLLVEWLLVALLATGLVAVLTLTDSLRRLDNVAYDLFQRLPYAKTIDPALLLVEIDDRSLAELGAWPWSRNLHAQLIEKIAAARPQAVVYAILFAEPSSDPEADKNLGRAIAAAGNVYLPIADIDGRQASLPAAAITAGAGRQGLVTVHTDSDGLVRRMYPFEYRGEQVEPHLMTMVDRATRTGPPAVAPPQSALLIPFKPPGRFKSVAFSSVLRGEIPVEALSDKIILVGVTAAGVGERFSTPTTGGASSLPGVELLANILSGLRTGMIHPAGVATNFVFSIAPIWLLLAGFWTLTPRWTLVATVVLALAVVLGSGALVLLARLWIPPSAALSGLIVLSPLWSWRRLSAISDYLGAELQRLGTSTDLPAPHPEISRADPVTRQTLTLGAAISHIQETRRFAADALFSLPDATLLVDRNACVSAANGAAQALFAGAGSTVSEGSRVGELLNALMPQGQRFASDWPAGQEVNPGLAFDIADGRSFEVQVVERNTEDGRRIAWIVRLADVTAMKAALRQRESAVQLLTHDMRSPQISILALIEASKDQVLDSEMTARIASYSRRTLELADGFVNLARAEEAPAEREVIDLCDVVAEAVDELWPQSQRRGIVVLQSNCTDPRYVLGERQILTRALVNLIGNAIKYGPANTAVEVYIYSAGTSERPMVGTAVKDHGPGLTREQAAAAFDPFRRLARDQPIEGAGLGLAFVRAAARRHGGVAACDSAPGEGATFTLELPEYIEGRSALVTSAGD